MTPIAPTGQRVSCPLQSRADLSRGQLETKVRGIAVERGFSNQSGCCRESSAGKSRPPEGGATTLSRRLEGIRAVDVVRRVYPLKQLQRRVVVRRSVAPTEVHIIRRRRRLNTHPVFGTRCRGERSGQPHRILVERPCRIRSCATHQTRDAFLEDLARLSDSVRRCLQSARNVRSSRRVRIKRYGKARCRGAGCGSIQLLHAVDTLPVNRRDCPRRRYGEVVEDLGGRRSIRHDLRRSRFDKPWIAHGNGRFVRRSRGRGRLGDRRRRGMVLSARSQHQQCRHAGARGQSKAVRIRSPGRGRCSSTLQFFAAEQPVHVVLSQWGKSCMD